MSNFSKLALVLLLVFSGCAKAEEPVIDDNDFLKVDDPMPKPQGNNVSYPARYDVIFINPITISYPEIEGEGVVRGQYVEIDGLVDEAVENAINTELRLVTESMFLFQDRAQAPAYRGIDVRIPKDIGPAKRVDVYSQVHYNANNILSVSISASSCFEKMAIPFCFSVTEGLNYDLISGKRLSLADVFTDQTDVSKLLVPKINQQLYWSTDFESSDTSQNLPELIAPFTQLGGSQSFILGDYTLGLLFGPKTSELDTHLHGASVHIPYTELLPNLALSQRFASETSIFVDEIIEKRFVDQLEEERIVTTKTLHESHPKIVATSSYFKSLDSSKVELIETEIQKIHAFIQEASTILPEVKRAMVVVSFYKIGKYTQQSTHMRAYQLEDEIHDGQDGEWSIEDIGPQVGSQHTIVTDEDGNVLTLKDLFVSGYDYEESIAAKLLATLQKNDLPGLDNLRQWMENLDFVLYQNYIGFYSFTKIESVYESVYFIIQYKEFKASNLAIFD